MIVHQLCDKEACGEPIMIDNFVINVIIIIMIDNYNITIEGFGGKRALGFLLKIELCRKRSKFRMQLCLGTLNNVLCFFAEVFFVCEILRMQKSLYLWSHQHVTGKNVISLIIQQNIDLLQRVTLKSVDFRVKPSQF